MKVCRIHTENIGSDLKINSDRHSFRIHSINSSKSEKQLLEKLKSCFPSARAINNITTHSQRVSSLSAAEKMAVNLYSGDSYESLNRKLRSGQSMTPAEQLLDIGLSKAVAKEPLDVLTKTYRGSRLRDAFGSVAEGEFGVDPAYLSTSRDPEIACEFAEEHKRSAFSVIFGVSGFDMALVNGDTVEAEVLYPKATPMRVLLRDVNKGKESRVLEELSVSETQGHVPALLDALDLAK
ncbi:exoenzyme T [Vibrio parahaemolyticus]|uniref:T3SS effector ADP-ribosyltransferase toxin VopT n=1 Tax=Vibrio parahaemolyticus TaxID=670 RepID=UPI002AD3B670|nr:T3SS effector ADP-ribosyltransferase toxin VopT [Vibrio parahaemolyticus]MQC88047.1 exoenzyme T [Vibrio parahaemolyticus]